VDYRYDSIPRS